MSERSSLSGLKNEGTLGRGGNYGTWMGVRISEHNKVERRKERKPLKWSGGLLISHAGAEEERNQERQRTVRVRPGSVWLTVEDVFP